MRASQSAAEADLKFAPSRKILVARLYKRKTLLTPEVIVVCLNSLSICFNPLIRVLRPDPAQKLLQLRAVSEVFQGVEFLG